MSTVGRIRNGGEEESALQEDGQWGRCDEGVTSSSPVFRQDAMDSNECNYNGTTPRNTKPSLLRPCLVCSFLRFRVFTGS